CNKLKRLLQFISSPEHQIREKDCVDSTSAAQAVEKLIQEYGKLVFHTIYGLTGNREESQDLTQDTFLQALKSIDAARAKSGLHFHAKAWLMQIALNSVRMQRRRDSLFRFIPFSHMENARKESVQTASSAPTDGVIDQEAAPLQPAGYGANAQADLESVTAERDAVQRVMQQISPPLRECLLLSIIGQFSTVEIARLLNIEEAAVRQRLARARKQFQQLYAQMGGEELIDAQSPINSSGMSQNRLPRHHSPIERVESRAFHALSQP
ncbi:MAG TPA: sigma-70 family RNA polymerase sigma factor, partial [Ktedonobacteraceae bacterium]|nr:sigma-70 family RNA polymerase sigma factor [Ktedonobacteraceae bacterium]